jgi:putative Mn2+ efflux pump MntP
MSILEIILIAVGLSMDAFAVSITLGLSVQKPKLKHIIIPGVYFGFFQALMPSIGYFAGTYFADKIQSIDHWIAFVLLGFIGGKMIQDSFKTSEENVAPSFAPAKMLALAVATSIDALAVGITFAFFNVRIMSAAAITGAITFIISASGVLIGGVFGAKFKSKAECIGGIVLIAIGTKIVIEHILLGKG